METIAKHDIEPIDMVVVSLYPFEQVANRRGVEDETVIENIDIGGPSMIRAAAKNHASRGRGHRPRRLRGRSSPSCRPTTAS